MAHDSPRRHHPTWTRTCIRGSDICHTPRSNHPGGLWTMERLTDGTSETDCGIRAFSRVSLIYYSLVDLLFEWLCEIVTISDNILARRSQSNSATPAAKAQQSPPGSPPATPPLQKPTAGLTTSGLPVQSVSSQIFQRRPPPYDLSPSHQASN